MCAAEARKEVRVELILANLFLHYAFDLWMGRAYPDLPWCRYADDGLVHCRTEQEAQTVKASLQARLAECRLALHPDKTKIVYCKDGKRQCDYAPLAGLIIDGAGDLYGTISIGGPHDGGGAFKITP